MCVVTGGTLIWKYDLHDLQPEPLSICVAFILYVYNSVMDIASLSVFGFLTKGPSYPSITLSLIVQMMMMTPYGF